IAQKRVNWTPLVMAVVVELIRRYIVAPSLGPDVPVYSYGVMLVTGFFACLQLGKFLGRRSGIDPEVFVNAGLIALVTGVIGSRLNGCCYGAECNTKGGRWTTHKAYGRLAYTEEVRKGRIKPEERIIVHGPDGAPMRYADGTRVLSLAAINGADQAL